MHALRTSLNISDYQYSIALTVTYIPYMASELPANLLLRRIGPNIFLPTIATIWGIITTLQGFVKNHAGLVAVRFFLGLVEGGMFPGIVLYLSCFYTRELQLRIALFFSSASLAGAFSGLLAYGLMKLDGRRGIPGWAWIFIVEGMFTFLCGLCGFTVFPASIETNKFLKPEEKAVLKERLEADRPQSSTEAGFSWDEVVATVQSTHVIINTVSLFCSGTMIYSLAYFQPSIIQSFGYSADRTQLLSVPPFAVAFVVMLATAYISDRFRIRGLTACGSSFMAMIGFLMFFVARPNQIPLKYGSLFLSVAGTYSCIPPLSAWQANNSEGHYRRATAIAMGFVATNCGGILSTWIFPHSDAPRFRTGTLVNLILSIGILIFTGLNLLWLREANRRKVTHREVMLSRYNNSNSKETEDSKLAWQELGDQHPDFMYVY